MKRIKYSSLLIALATSAILNSGSAHAFDPSKVIQKDTSSNVVIEYFLRFKKEGKPQNAVDVLKYAAENGNSAAQWKLARVYETGDGVKKNPLEAFNIFKNIADQSGSAVPNSDRWQYGAYAFVALGDYYRTGIPNTVIIPDQSKARIMYTTAAMVYRHPDAQFELGRMQVNNERNRGENSIGIRNLSLAYQKGHVGAEALLGSLIFEGVYAKHDPVRGLFMIGNAKRRASEKNIEWIRQIYDEAYSLAKPNHRAEAVQQLKVSTNSIQ